MTTNNSNSILIFHRSKNNSEEAIINQQAFFKTHPEIANSAKIIDYVTGDFHKAREIFDTMNLTDKITVIINSFLSENDFYQQYDLYPYFEFFKTIGKTSIHLMDCKGRLYKETKTLEDK